MKDSFLQILRLQMYNKKTIQIFIYLAVFSIAMGYLEGAVVVYLRMIFYPEGFTFPLNAIDQHTAVVEILREAATLIMLAGAGIIAGRTRTEKFGLFLYCFAIWDIFYYVFLKLLIGWPESLLTWDILFLIPVTWVGPVIAPVINSLTMIVLAGLISYFTDKKPSIYLKKPEWLLLILGSLVTIISYTFDYLNFMLRRFNLSDFFDPLMQSEILENATGYIPQSFPWWIFIIGELILLSAIYRFHLRQRKAI
jgi:hypothetical protein